MILIIITGNTYAKVNTLFGLMGVNIGSESFYNTKIIPKMDIAVSKILDRFLLECRLNTPNIKDVHLIVDAGWSHPGWWARECTVIAIDSSTGLTLAVKHVLKGKEREYSGSSKGMEGYGILAIMKELDNIGIKVTKIIHDKDASTMIQVMDVFEDVEECLCLSKIHNSFNSI